MKSNPKVYGQRAYEAYVEAHISPTVQPGWWSLTVETQELWIAAALGAIGAYAEDLTEMIEQGVN